MRPVLGAAALGLAALGFAAPAGADSTLAFGGKASVNLDFRVVVPQVLRVEALEHPARLALTAEDVARGYVDLDGATRLDLTANARGGVAVAVTIDPRIARRVVVRLPGSVVVATGDGGSAHLDRPAHGRAHLRVGYRIYLGPDAQPGEHAWPVALRFSAGAA